jgi:hypothetical protein
MASRSNLFRGDAKLEAAAVLHPAHIVPAPRANTWARSSNALIALDDALIDQSELEGKHYARPLPKPCSPTRPAEHRQPLVSEPSGQYRRHHDDGRSRQGDFRSRGSY